MDALLNAAPPGVAGSDVLSKVGVGGSTGGLTAAASAFTKLGLKPDLLGKAVPVLTSFVTKSGGGQVGSLLAGALK